MIVNRRNLNAVNDVIFTTVVQFLQDVSFTTYTSIMQINWKVGTIRKTGNVNSPLWFRTFSGISYIADNIFCWYCRCTISPVPAHSSAWTSLWPCQHWLRKFRSSSKTYFHKTMIVNVYSCTVYLDKKNNPTEIHFYTIQ